MIDTKSGTPKIVHRWNLQHTLPEQTVVTPKFSRLKWQDLDGNAVLGETELQSLILRGKVSNAADVRDVFVHLNDEKVFYSAWKVSEEDNEVNAEAIDAAFLFAHTKRDEFASMIHLRPGLTQNKCIQ